MGLAGTGPLLHQERGAFNRARLILRIVAATILLPFLTSNALPSALPCSRDGNEAPGWERAGASVITLDDIASVVVAPA